MATKKKTKLPCPVPGCERGRLSADMLMCRTHWYRVSASLRDRVWRLFRDQRGSVEHRRACAEAIQEAAEASGL